MSKLLENAISTIENPIKKTALKEYGIPRY
jgi:hypothetical protein